MDCEGGARDSISGQPAAIAFNARHVSVQAFGQHDGNRFLQRLLFAVFGQIIL